MDKKVYVTLQNGKVFEGKGFKCDRGVHDARFAHRLCEFARVNPVNGGNALPFEIFLHSSLGAEIRRRVALLPNDVTLRL